MKINISQLSTVCAKLDLKFKNKGERFSDQVCNCSLFLQCRFCVSSLSS